MPRTSSNGTASSENKVILMRLRMLASLVGDEPGVSKLFDRLWHDPCPRNLASKMYIFHSSDKLVQRDRHSKIRIASDMTYLSSRCCSFLSLFYLQRYASPFYTDCFHSLLDFLCKAPDQIIHSIRTIKSNAIITLEGEIASS